MASKFLSNGSAKKPWKYSFHSHTHLQHGGIKEKCTKRKWLFPVTQARLSPFRSIFPLLSLMSTKSQKILTEPSLARGRGVVNEHHTEVLWKVWNPTHEIKCFEHLKKRLGAGKTCVRRKNILLISGWWLVSRLFLIASVIISLARCKKIKESCLFVAHVLKCMLVVVKPQFADCVLFWHTILQCVQENTQQSRNKIVS